MTKFRIGSPASSHDLIDRKKELSELYTKMSSKSINYNVAVLGHRRVGKTSILMKLYDKLEKDANIIPIYFDVQKNMAEPKIFFTRLQKTIFDAYIQKSSGIEKIKASTKITTELVGKLIDAAKSKKITGISAEMTNQGTIIPKIEFGDKKPDYASVFYSVFKTLNVLSKGTDFKFVIILDEFQDFIKLTRYKGLTEISNLFRAIIQEREENVSYIICGSRVHMLTDILSNGESPLFAHFEKMVIYEMEEKYSVELFTKYLKARKITIKKDVAHKAYELVGGIPFYLMVLAQATTLEQDIKDTFYEILSNPLGALKNYMDYILSEDLASITGGPILKTILRALATSEKGLTYSELGHKIDVSTTSLTSYMSNLRNSDLIDKVEKKFIIRDKILREYLKIEARELD